MAIAAEIKRRYSAGSILVRLIYINIAVFLVVRIAALIGMFMNQPAIQLLQWIEFPSGDMVLHRPWTLLTYMFSHYDLFHVKVMGVGGLRWNSSSGNGQPSGNAPGDGTSL